MKPSCYYASELTIMVRCRGRGKVSEDQRNRTDNLGLSTETLPRPGHSFGVLSTSYMAMTLQLEMGVIRIEQSVSIATIINIFNTDFTTL